MMGRKTHKRTCEICGVSFAFSSRNPSVQTCSKACGYALIRKRGDERRRQPCTICGKMFTRPRKPFRKTCSEECSKEGYARGSRGKKQSAETIAKRARSLKEVWADPERNAGLVAAGATNMKIWLSDPENAKAFAARSSERMRLRHTDPEFRKRSDERSSKLMKANWVKHREKFMAMAAERYLRMQEGGYGICADDAKQRKAVAAKWIMKKAQAALHAETALDEKLSELHYRLRREMPYDGPQDSSDYIDYCEKLCRAITTHPEVRKIADPFMSEAIPRFAKEWQRRKRLVTA